LLGARFGNKEPGPNKPPDTGVEEILPNKPACYFFSTFFYYFLVSDGIFCSFFSSFWSFWLSSGFGPLFIPVVNKLATATAPPSKLFSSFFAYPLASGSIILLSLPLKSLEFVTPRKRFDCSYFCVYFFSSFASFF
jgi:hypothetical protein